MVYCMYRFGSLFLFRLTDLADDADMGVALYLFIVLAADFGDKENLSTICFKGDFKDD